MLALCMHIIFLQCNLTVWNVDPSFKCLLINFNKAPLLFHIMDCFIISFQNTRGSCLQWTDI
jgi:hypothetical protein